ncbi:MAG TPA: M67 family metallopeptidase [Acidimicrobiales bacterium]|nr:M67 family metallopeptidase [Acidimicrobiales bacterium]
MLRLHRHVYLQMIGDCYEKLPNEACGLVAGPAPQDGLASAHLCYPITNAAASSRVYELDPKGHLRADRDAEDRGLQLIGVYHSHTHTVAYPSPTDVASAPDPEWHYILVSMADEAPVVRSYRIVGGNITEEPVVVLN